MERRGVAVHADVRDPASGPDELGGELERLRYADSLDGHVGAEPTVRLHDRCNRVDGTRC